MTRFDSVPDYLWQAAILLAAILIFQIAVRGEFTLSIAVIAVIGFVFVSWAVESIRDE
ncbi:hypothetical protein [Halostagnicola bangensis]